MNEKNVERLDETVSTRRQVIETGAKLAYVAPVVAASFKLTASSAAALSPTCTPGTCQDPEVCGTRCGCREVGGTAYCLQQVRCSEAQICGGDVVCPPGYVCLVDSCCKAVPGPRCVPICGSNGDARSSSVNADDDEWVLGPNL